MFNLKYKTARQKYLASHVYDLAEMMIERMIDYEKHNEVDYAEREVMEFLREKLDGDFDEVVMSEIPEKESN